MRYGKVKCVLYSLKDHNPESVEQVLEVELKKLNGQLAVQYQGIAELMSCIQFKSQALILGDQELLDDKCNQSSGRPVDHAFRLGKPAKHPFPRHVSPSVNSDRSLLMIPIEWVLQR